MATPFVRGMTFTSRVATADINSLTFQRRAEIPKSVMSKPFVRGYGEGGNPAYPNCFSIPLNPPFRPLSLFEYFPQKGKEKESLFIGEACVLSCLLQIIRYVAITKSSPWGFRGLPNIFSHNAVIHLNTKKAVVRTRPARAAESLQR